MARSTKVPMDLAAKRSLTMIEAVAVPPIAAQGPAATGVPGSTGAPQVDLPAEPLQRPSAAQADEFARASGTAELHDVQATPPSSDGGLAGRIARQADALASQLKMPAAAGQPATADVQHEGGLSSKDTMNAAVSQMERAYMFAIETTMASRGSTETTKIFNTLLKGQ